MYEDLDTGEIKEMIFDMVVLATCIIPPQGIEKLAEILGLELNKFNFIKTTPFIPVETSREGIFTCGCVHEPMDIPRSVAEASGAAVIGFARRRQRTARKWHHQAHVSCVPPRR